MDVELVIANLRRTFVPLAVGAAANLLIDGDQGVGDQAGFVVSAVYYAAFRVIETRYPWVGFFLGKRMPSGTPTARAAGVPGPVAGEAVRVATDPGSGAVTVSVAGHELTGVESVEWSTRVGETPLLRLALRDVRADFGSPG